MATNSDDIDVYSSTDGGTTYTKVATMSDYLLNAPSTIYLKVLMAVAATGQKIKVSYWEEV